MEMDYDPSYEAKLSGNDVNIGEPEVESNKDDILESASSDGELIGELGNVSGVLTRVELDLACASEKLLNLSGFMMHVATKESDYEAFVSKEEQTPVNSVEKALEFTFLSGILDSEVSEFDKDMVLLQMEIKGSQELLASYNYFGEAFVVMEGKLHDSEQSLRQLQDQVSDIRMQSLKLQRTFSCSDGEENGSCNKKVGHLEDDILLSKNVQIKMQTVEQQRQILRVLEKALAREMDLEKKLAESKQIEEDLKLRLLASEQEVYFMEDEAADAWKRWLEADNASGIVMSISKELLDRLQHLHFNVNGSVQREAELLSNLDGELEAKEISLKKIKRSNVKVNDIFQAQTDSLKDRLQEAEDKLILTDSKAFTSSGNVSSVEEKNNVLCSEIRKMESSITDLKEKNSKAEGRAENSEAKCKLLTDKCIILTESNGELSEELSYLKGKLKCLKAVLHQAEEAKIATATDIALQSKIITSSILQLGFERERLHKQMSSLTMENKNLILKLQMNNFSSVVMLNDDRGNGKDFMPLKHDMATGTNESREEAYVLSACNSKSDMTQNTEIEPADIVRKADAGVLNLKHLLIAIIIVLISVSAYFSINHI